MCVAFCKKSRRVFWPFSLALNAHFFTQVQCTEQNSKTKQKPSRKNNAFYTGKVDDFQNLYVVYFLSEEITSLG